MPTAKVYRQRSKFRWCCWIVYLAVLTGGVNAAVPVAPYFNGTFPLQAPGTTGWTTRNAFPNLTFTDPLWMSEIPGTGEMLVLVKGGQIWRFPSDPAVTPAQRTQVLDISDRIQLAPELGLLRMAFHPRFGQGGSGSNDVFLCYSHRPPGTTASIDTNLWRISRFQWQPATGTIDPASEQVLIQQYDPNGWHNGGAMAFDNNGYLLITCGDGGGSNGQYGLVQQLTGGFFGGVLRIDVDNDPARSHPIRRQPAASSKPAGYPANFSQGYGIPNDNPWLDPAGTKLEEFQAIGLRSPHTAHYDPVSGELWIADVGQSQREEINRLSPGANFGWPFREGTLTGPQFKPNPLIGTETLPFHSYDHQVGGCIIGGLRYRGARWASRLGGKVIFGDNVKGTLYAATPGSDANPPTTELLFEGFGTAVYSGISGLATDAAGEIYVLQLNGAGQAGATIRIMELQEQFPEPPALLSQTGLFTDTAALLPSPALVPYEVASPLWSDGALKRRWMAIPNDGIRSSSLERITYSQTGNWSFPNGTIFVKHFEIPVDARDPAQVKRLETRVMVCAPLGKYGVTYRWNSAGTDATLISAGQDETFDVTDENGGTASRTWSYPSRANCMECHTSAAGQSLGLRTHQIKRPVAHPLTGAAVDQLSYFNDEKILLASATEIAQAVPAAGIGDESFPIEHRVRSWLDSNCAHCHQPGATAPYFDARLQTPLRNQGLINGLITGHFSLPGGRYLKPGDSALSAIHVRVASVVPGIAMPPLGKHVADEEGVALLTEYIDGLTNAEFAEIPPPQARYVRLTGSNGVSNSMGIAEFRILDVSHAAIPLNQLAIAAVSAEQVVGNAALAIDGNSSSYWQSTATPFPHFITLDLGAVREIGGFEFALPQSTSMGSVKAWDIHFSNNGTDWTLLRSGTTLRGFGETVRYTIPQANRPVRVSLAAPAYSYGADFPVTVIFDTSVTDFTGADLAVTGGTVQSLQGSGYYYTAVIRATAPQVGLTVRENSVSTGTYGSRVSNAVVIASDMEKSPVPSYSGVPGFVLGPFEVRLSFDRPVSSLDTTDFTVTNGKVEWVVADGDSYRIIISPVGYGSVSWGIADGVVTGKNGFAVAGGVSASTNFWRMALSMEAEHLYRPEAGFVVVEDPAASGGAYIWVPEGSRTETGPPPTGGTFVATTSLFLPFAGNYQLKGLTRADNLGSDTFHVRIYQSGPPIPEYLPWRTNQDPGEVGSLQFHSGYARDAGVPYVFTIPAVNGSNLTIAAAEDGTRLDRVELIPERPFGQWTPLPAVPGEGLKVALEFAVDVNGLARDDFETIDGRVTAIAGSGSRYTLTLRPYSSKMAIRLRENEVTDASGTPGAGSLFYMAAWPGSTYEEWAVAIGLNPLPTADHADVDGDGIGQLMEYALGLDPLWSDSRPIVPGDLLSRGLPRFELEPLGSGKRLVLVYRRRTGGTPLDYRAEFSSGLEDFVPTASGGEVTSIGEGWTEVRIPDPDTTLLEGTRFGRLKVERVE